MRRPSSFSHQLWIGMFTVSLTFLLLLGWSFLYLEPGTPSYVVGQISAVGLLLTLVGSIIALRSGWQPF